jgi:hypothetical protein
LAGYLRSHFHLYQKEPLLEPRANYRHQIGTSSCTHTTLKNNSRKEVDRFDTINQLKEIFIPGEWLRIEASAGFSKQVWLLTMGIKQHKLSLYASGRFRAQVANEQMQAKVGRINILRNNQLTHLILCNNS